MMYAIDECINEFEFRGFVAWYLEKKGYHFISMDDDRWSDEDSDNNNDIIVKKDDLKYTVQVYLNKKIDEEEINETIEDVKKEQIWDGIIFTNLNVPDELKSNAYAKNVIILDRSELANPYHDYKENEDK